VKGPAVDWAPGMLAPPAGGMAAAAHHVCVRLTDRPCDAAAEDALRRTVAHRGVRRLHATATGAGAGALMAAMRTAGLRKACELVLPSLCVIACNEPHWSPRTGISKTLAA
jgi:NAD(P)H-nitrite reductase large subunit